MSFITEVTVNIRNLAFGGAGVGEVASQSDGRNDLLGITAFVPFTAVGETVRARVSQRKDRYLQTELLEIISTAEDRVEPKCKLFTICGGCELQHLSYYHQLDTKKEMLEGALKVAKFPLSEIGKLQDVVESAEYNYRRRITLHVDPTGKVGFYREASRSVVATSECPVALPSINEVLTKIQDFGREVKGKISSILLDADDQGVVAVLKTPYALNKDECRSIMQIAKKFFTNALLMAGEKEIDGFGRQILELPLNEKATYSLRVPAGYFSQVNSKINSQLIAAAIKLSNIKLNQQVYDLYAGAGNFSLPFALAGAKVTAVECDKRLVNLGKENISRYNLQKNLTYVESSVEKFLAARDKKSPKIELIVADPPRSGLGSMVESINFANKLILVSCHQPSFIRDSKNLLEQGWKLNKIIPFDMFAQTSYLEILSYFTKDEQD
ncbi:MAG: class I SAM-dependent RNA methyltransferase [Proteobacteria bacterium]|nr:class I SAM-dependent RNA methyltransferase [Pseudomonadota bacterium]